VNTQFLGIRILTLLAVVAIATPLPVQCADRTDAFESAVARFSSPLGSRISATVRGDGVLVVQESWYSAKKHRTRTLISSTVENGSNLLYTESTSKGMSIWYFENEWLYFSPNVVAEAVKEIPAVIRLMELSRLKLPPAQDFEAEGSARVCGGSEKWTTTGSEHEKFTVYVSQHKAEGFPYICRIEVKDSVTTINENTFVVVQSPSGARKGKPKELVDILLRDLVDVLQR
jgi:hypothetical protein